MHVISPLPHVKLHNEHLIQKNKQTKKSVICHSCGVSADSPIATLLGILSTVLCNSVATVIGDSEPGPLVFMRSFTPEYLSVVHSESAGTSPPMPAGHTNGDL